MEFEGAAREGSEELLPYGISEEKALVLDLGPAIRTLAEKKIERQPGGSAELLISSDAAGAFADMARRSASAQGWIVSP